MPCLPRIVLLVAALACASALACDGSGGSSSAPVEIVPTPTIVPEGEPAPVLSLRILEVDGASGAGFFRPGDRLGVVFRLEHEDGSPWALEEMSEGLALVSGPTFRYQRVALPVDDVVARGVQRPDGSIRYELQSALPDVYAPPANDTASFGENDGELTGQPLLDGTYTLGLSFVWAYTVEGEAYRRIAEGTFDFPVGDGAGALRARAVTTQQNCERCHLVLTAHDGRHLSLGVCLLCHTVGSEDLNDPSIEGGTPGVTVDSRVLFHKLHSGRALPSVQGIGVNPDGTRNFDSGPRPYRIVGADGSVRDFSAIGFPAFPNRAQPMPRDQNWSSLTAEQRAQDLATRQGISSCFVCHGDPDGDGPIEAPEQGDLIHSQASRLACGACHDDIDWTQFYFVNGGMPAQLDDSGCAACHVEFENEIQTERAHVHPLRDPETSSSRAARPDDMSAVFRERGESRLLPPFAGAGKGVR
jgi:OmcA/MtrC family decaheme c-type cytochrome